MGAGGFGTVFLCHDLYVDGDVVVKTLHDMTLERNVNEMFREAQVLGHLHHPNIIGVRHCDFADPTQMARPYIVMDYFKGTSLTNVIHERGPLPLDKLLVVAKQIAQAMQVAHEHNILHRDLKPDNVLVCTEEDPWRLKVIDFGLAMRRQTIETSMALHPSGSTILGDSVAGTVKYAPPEQMGEAPGIKPGPYSRRLLLRQDLLLCPVPDDRTRDNVIGMKCPENWLPCWKSASRRG